eukprot:m.75801 g.75801  ORF g.75801 m.75801 type:complete len:247 (-) comp13145_c0_seq3:25-765(-)
MHGCASHLFTTHKPENCRILSGLSLRVRVLPSLARVVRQTLTPCLAHCDARFVCFNAFLFDSSSYLFTHTHTTNTTPHPPVAFLDPRVDTTDLLSRLKVECLKPYRPLAADKYRKHLDQYVQAIIGDPLEKITTFFDGVQQLIASGVPMAEVGFQFAYSKQELRARLKDYPGKEVRKGIEQMYKRVERHLCDEANLRVVVLRAMQEEFVNRYKHFESLMQSCYPGAQIKFEFTENELMSFFLDYTK